MRIAFTRSVDIGQAQPFLRYISKYVQKNEHQIKLFYTDGECNEEMFPGEMEKVPADVSCETLVEKIVDWKADVVISISLPDDNSLRDACVKEILMEKHQIPMIMHSMEATAIMCNKWETKGFLRNLGYAVTDGFLIHGDLINDRGIRYHSYRDFIFHKVQKMGFPIIVKPLWDSMSCGIQIMDTVEELRDYLTTNPPTADVLVEQFIEGELFGIEVLGCDGNYRCQPLVRKCSNSVRNLFPFDHLRFAPFTHESYPIQELEEMVLNIASKLEVSGSIDVELIYKDGIFYIIEINPRISGMTNLSSAVSGHNAFQCLLEMAEGEWVNKHRLPKQDRFVAEFPLENITPATAERMRNRDDVVYVSFNRYHDGRTQYKMMLSAVDAEDCFFKLMGLNEENKIVPIHIIEELRSSMT
ncbi:ATP-grasp domain-containing protein [Baia soyae]|uniref:D-Ala-D-Ala ligase-like protein n=1 Tax=Baia soyae TaxID=1544746 RepID=A0A4R2S0C9_9BACL|nr:ATP-grasp domain-containing protein [Baia soyae]TCP69461.1 D-Ala-D-Ala ligase-like protein [Baia soyae]